MATWPWEFRIVKMRSRRAVLLRALSQSLKDATTSLALGLGGWAHEELLGEGDGEWIKQEYE